MQDVSPTSLHLSLGRRVVAGMTWLLVVLAMGAVLCLPFLKAMHERTHAHADAPSHATPAAFSVDDHEIDDHAIETSLSDHTGHDHGTLTHDHPAGGTPHDDAHCVICLSISQLQQVISSPAFAFALRIEPAPRFVEPVYLAPTTSEPAIRIAIPRGPPVLA